MSKGLESFKRAERIVPQIDDEGRNGCIRILEVLGELAMRHREHNPVAQGDQVTSHGACAKSGQVCGGAGQANDVCTPKTWKDLGAVCGQVADACGGLTDDCGSCTDDLACNNGACVTAWEPLSCDAVGAECGSIADGCGGLVDCGACPKGEPCGYGDQPNECQVTNVPK